MILTICNIISVVLSVIAIGIAIKSHKIAKKTLEIKTVESVCTFIDNMNGKNLVTKIINNSKQPIHNVILISTHTKSNGDYVTELKEFPYKFFQVIPPGEITTEIQSLGSAMGGDQPAVSILFTDYNNKEWYISAGHVNYPAPDYAKELFENGEIPPFTYEQDLHNK